jgi:hypothetical protein
MSHHHLLLLQGKRLRPTLQLLHGCPFLPAHCCLGAMCQAQGEIQALVLGWKDLIGLQSPLQSPMVPAKQQHVSIGQQQKAQQQDLIEICLQAALASCVHAETPSAIAECRSRDHKSARLLHNGD